MKTDEVVIKHSKIHGKGVFATRDFKAGDVVLRWDKSSALSIEAVKKLTSYEKRYVNLEDGIYVQMQEPEKYVNHSCESNTTAKQFCDIATRDIKQGEEVTSNYNEALPASENLKCNCGSSKCSDSVVC